MQANESILDALMRPPLTPAQYDCLCVIQELTDAGPVSPSLNDIARELDLRHRSAVHKLVSVLVARGYLARVPRRMRNLVILKRVALPDFTWTGAGAQAEPV